MTPLAAMSLTKPMFPFCVTPLLTVNSNECVRCRQSMSPAATTPPANSSGADGAEAAAAITGSLELVSRQCDTANGHMMQPQGIWCIHTAHPPRSPITPSATIPSSSLPLFPPSIRAQAAPASIVSFSVPTAASFAWSPTVAAQQLPQPHHPGGGITA